MSIKASLTEEQIKSLISERQSDSASAFMHDNLIIYTGDYHTMRLSIFGVGLISLKIETLADVISPMLNIQFIIDNFNSNNPLIRIIPGLTFVYDKHTKRQWCSSWLYGNKPCSITSKMIVDCSIDKFISRQTNEDIKEEAIDLFNIGIDIVQRYGKTTTFSKSIID